MGLGRREQSLTPASLGSELDLRRQLDLSRVVGLENTTEVGRVRDAARKNERRRVERVEELEA